MSAQEPVVSVRSSCLPRGPRKGSVYLQPPASKLIDIPLAAQGGTNEFKERSSFCTPPRHTTRNSGRYPCLQP